MQQHRSGPLHVDIEGTVEGIPPEGFQFDTAITVTR
jgi:hypothetical protein